MNIRFTATFACILAATVALAATKGSSLMSSLEVEKINCDQPLNSINAPSNEPNFNDVFNAQIQLPVSEQLIVDLLNESGVKFFRLGLGTDWKLIAPLHCYKFPLTGVSHQYRVVYGYNDLKRREEIFLVFVNFNGDVIYIENYFMYEPS